MKNNKQLVNQEKTQRITVEVPKQWVDIIDSVCAKSFAPRRTWVMDAIYKKLVSEKLIDIENNE
jgi:metal-responsive CopG/Arc/MetJ family transcriptional regulator